LRRLNVTVCSERPEGAGSSLLGLPRTLNLRPRSPYPPLGSIPYGRADLLLGIDILEAARAIDPREQFRVASPDRTATVLNLYKQPTSTRCSASRTSTPRRCGRRSSTPAGRAQLRQDLSSLCEQRLGSKLYANIMMLGVAFQLGLIPVSAWSIAWAIKDSIRRDHRKNLKAFNIGRKLALEPARCRTSRPRDVGAARHEQDADHPPHAAVRAHASMAFEKLVQGAMKQMRDLPEEAKYDLALRIYDLMQYQDAELREGVRRARAARLPPRHRRARLRRHRGRHLGPGEGDADQGRGVRQLPADALREEAARHREVRRRRVQRRPHRLPHHTSPEFNVGKYRVRMRITTQDWQLKLVSHMKWWRKLPGWHKRENAFRDWYVGLLERVNLAGDANYAQAVRVLRLPEGRHRLPRGPLPQAGPGARTDRGRADPAAGQAGSGRAARRAGQPA
jgi:indolepyruvate ferredoxin oxidoreductase